MKKILVVLCLTLILTCSCSKETGEVSIKEIDSKLYIGLSMCRDLVIEEAITEGANLNYKGAVSDEYTSPLHTSILYCPKYSTYFIEHGVDLDDSFTTRNETALMAAVKLNRIEIVKSLLEHGADVNIEGYVQSGKKYSAIDIAISQGYTEITEILLEYGAIIKQSSIDLWDLQYSDIFKHIDYTYLNRFRILYDNAIDTEFTEVEYLALAGKTELLNKYITINRISENELNVILSATFTYGDVSTLKTLKEMGYNLASQYDEEFVDAGIFSILQFNTLEMLKFVENDFQIQYHIQEYQYLLYAMKNNSSEILNYLLDDVGLKITIGLREYDEFWNEISYTNSQLIELASINQITFQNFTIAMDHLEYTQEFINVLLFETVQLGSYEVINDLIKRGADVNFVGATQNDILSGAIGQNRVDVAKLLLNSGAYVNGYETQGVKLEVETMENTLAFNFVKATTKEMLDLLIEHHAYIPQMIISVDSPCYMYNLSYLQYYFTDENIQYIQKNGYNSLMYCAVAGISNKMFDYVFDNLEVNIDSRLTYEYGEIYDNTLIMEACKYEQIYFVKRILTRNPDLSYVNSEGKTAMDIAVESNNQEIISILENYEHKK